MPEIRVIAELSPERIDAATRVWVAATEARDGADHFQTFAWARPRIADAADAADAVLLTVLDADDTAVAFAVTRSSGPGVAILSFLAVAPTAQGQGVARGLLGEVDRRLRAAGFAAAELWVREGNRAAIGAYERLGWRSDGPTQVNHDSGHLMLHYVLDL